MPVLRGPEEGSEGYMFQFSRAIYRELACDIDSRAGCPNGSAHEHVLKA